MDDFEDLTASGGPSHSGPEPLRPGREIAYFRIEQLLGAGGMGQVYLAEDLRLHRKVALKTLSPHMAADADFRERFRSEARAAARLSHPGITTVYSFETVDDLLLIAMEYVEGATLKQMVRTGPLDAGLVAAIATQCSEALAEAHRQRVIHRDIKSSNILLTSMGRTKITDFGLAKLMLDDDMTASAATVGTYQYMSPEQILGREVDYRTDLFSLGVVLFELLTGQLPYGGKTVAEVTRALSTAPVPSLPGSANIPVALQQVVYRCLQRDLHARYQKASEITADLAGGPVRAPVVPDPSRQRVALAVFPFVDVDPGEESHYFAESLTEELIVRLSKIRAFRIASRSSVFRYSSDRTDLLVAASQLGVDVFLSGRFRQVDREIRLTLELARTADGSIVWSDVLVRHADELQDLQLAVVEHITDALDIQLSAREERTVVRKYTYDLEAYDLYLRGKFHSRKRDRESLLRAAAYYERALALDAAFTEARASLSVTNALLFVYGHDPSPKRAEQALSLALTAVQERQNSSESHLALGAIYRQNNIAKGIRELERAVGLDGSNTEARHFLANTYVVQGHYRAAIAQEQKALELDSGYIVSCAHLCRIFAYLDDTEQYERSLAKLQEGAAGQAVIPATLGWRRWLALDWQGAVAPLADAIAQEPRALFSRGYLADCLIHVKELEQARLVIEDGLKLGHEHFSLVQYLGVIAAAQGDDVRASEMFTRAEALLRGSAYGWIQERSPLFHSQMGVLEARRGRLNRAMEHVSIAVGEGYGHYAGLEKDPQWLPLRARVDFVGLAASVRKRRASEDRGETGGTGN